MIFEAVSVYTTSEDGNILLANRTVRQAKESRATSINEAIVRPLAVSGLRLGDFAVYASLADKNGVAEAPYLVTKYADEDAAVITPCDLLTLSPEVYVTKHLAHSIQFLDPLELQELLHFEDSTLLAYIEKRFPHSSK